MYLYPINSKPVYIRNNAKLDSNYYQNNKDIAFTGIIKTSDRLVHDCYKSLIFKLNNRSFKITKYDTPEIINARIKIQEYGTTNPKTIKIHNPERIYLRKKIENHLYGTGAVKKEKTAFITIGLPGCGKTSVFNKKFLKENGALAIENDYIRHALPEYKNGLGIFEVRDEVKLIQNNILSKAISNGDNISITSHGANYLYLLDLCNRLRKRDYNIHLTLIDLPAKKAAERAIKRFYETGKFSDPVYHVFLGNIPEITFKLLTTVNKNLFEKYSVYSNDVPIGTPPVLIREMINK